MNSGMGLNYDARCRQLHAVGGDCYEFVPLTNERLAIAIGDASGKGQPAALMIANVQSSLRTAASFAEDNLAAMLEAVNRQVHATSAEDRYATLFYGVVDRTTRTLRYVNAGHHPPMVMRSDGSIVKLGTGGIPVGLFPDSVYEEGDVQLNPGDLVLAYTDGVVEVENPAGEEWGIDGLRSAVTAKEARNPDDIINAVFTSMDEFSRGRQADDATVVALQVH